MAEQLVPVISPEGQPGNIPLANLDAAVKRGFRQGTFATSPEGVKGILPMDKVDAALKKGFTNVGVPRASAQKAPTAPPDATVGSVGREAVLGAGSGLGLPESRTPFMDLIRGLGKQTSAEEGLNPILNAPSVSKVPAMFSKLLPIGRPVGNVVEGIAQNHIQEGKQAIQDFKKGDFVHGAARAAGTVAPIFGPGLAEGGIETQEGIKAGDPNAIGHGGGRVVGSILGSMLGRASGQRAASTAIEKVGGGVVRGVEKVGETIKTAAGQFDPALLNAEQSATKALKPRNSISDWKGKLATALPDAKRAADNLKIEVKTLDHAKQATLQAKKDIWAEYENNFLAPNAKILEDGKPVADNIRATISDRVAEQNPGFAKKVNKIADTYEGKKLTLAEIEDRVQELNNDLAGVMARTKVSRRIAERTPELAPKFAELNTLKTILNNSLEKFAGPGAPALKQRYGAQVMLEDVLERRINVADRAAPESLIEQMGRMQAAGKMAAGTAKLVVNPVAGLADIAEGGKALLAARKARQLNDANFLIGQSFSKAKATAPAAMKPKPIVPEIFRRVSKPKQLQAGQYEAPPSSMNIFADKFLGKMKESTPKQLPAGQYAAPASSLPPRKLLPGYKEPIITPPPGGSTVKDLYEPPIAHAAESIVVRDPRTGQFRRQYVTSKRGSSGK